MHFPQLRLRPPKLISQLSKVNAGLENHIPQGTADAISEGLVRKMMMVVIPLHVYKGASIWVSIMEVIVHQIVAQIPCQSSRKNYTRMEEQEAERRINDGGEYCSRQRREH